MDMDGRDDSLTGPSDEMMRVEMVASIEESGGEDIVGRVKVAEEDTGTVGGEAGMIELYATPGLLMQPAGTGSGPPATNFMAAHLVVQILVSIIPIPSLQEYVGRGRRSRGSRPYTRLVALSVGESEIPYQA
jgi:hypothetical protein